MESKAPDTSGLVKTFVLIQKLEKLRTKYKILVVQFRKQIITRKHQALRKDILVLLIISKLLVKIFDAKTKEK